MRWEPVKKISIRQEPQLPGLYSASLYPGSNTCNISLLQHPIYLGKERECLPLNSRVSTVGPKVGVLVRGRVCLSEELISHIVISGYQLTSRYKKEERCYLSSAFMSLPKCFLLIISLRSCLFFSHVSPPVRSPSGPASSPRLWDVFPQCC